MLSVGLRAHYLLTQAQVMQERLARRYQERCAEAACVLQAAIEAPRDDHFGALVREALERAQDVRQAKGGQALTEKAEICLRVWGEVQMALQVAMRSGRAEAVKLALSEAKANRLPAHHSLVSEAQQLI